MEHQMMNAGQDGRLADRQAITDVLVQYCRALDLMDLPALVALFTDDCVVEYGSGEFLRSRGSEALQKSLARMWRWSRTSHHLSNVLIRFEGEDDAVSSSYVHAWHERPDGSTATIFGQYRDRFVRRDQGWRISERRMFMNGCDAGFTVNINRLDRAPPPPGWTAPDID